LTLALLLSVEACVDVLDSAVLVYRLNTTNMKNDNLTFISHYFPVRLSRRIDKIIAFYTECL